MRTKPIEIGVLMTLSVVVIADGIALASTWKERMRALESGGFEILLGVLLAVFTYVYWRREPGEDWDNSHGAIYVAAAFGILCGYVLLMPHLGYLLSTLLAVTAYMRGLANYRWVSSIAFATVFAVGSAWFWAKLIIVLPQGILPWPEL